MNSSYYILYLVKAQAIPRKYFLVCKILVLKGSTEEQEFMPETL